MIVYYQYQGFIDGETLLKINNLSHGYVIDEDKEPVFSSPVEPVEVHKDIVISEEVLQKWDPEINPIW